MTDHGKMDLFPATVGQFVAPDGSLAKQTNKSLNLAYFDGNTVTAIWNYAQRFAMSDHFFQIDVRALGRWRAQPGVGAGERRHGRQEQRGPNVLIDGGAGSFTVIGDVDPIGDICSSSKRIQVTMGGRNIGDLLTAANVLLVDDFEPLDITAVTTKQTGSPNRWSTSTACRTNSTSRTTRPFRPLRRPRTPRTSATSVRDNR